MVTSYHKDGWLSKTSLCVGCMVFVRFHTGHCSIAQNDLTFLRIRTKKHEIMVSPGEIVVQFCRQLSCMEVTRHKDTPTLVACTLQRHKL